LFCVGILFTEPLAEIKKIIVSAGGSILNRFAIHPVKLSKVFGTPASLGAINSFCQQHALLLIL
jgi:hypothetical protein